MLAIQISPTHEEFDTPYFDILGSLDTSGKGFVSKFDLFHAIYACGFEIDVSELESSLAELRSQRLDYPTDPIIVTASRVTTTFRSVPRSVSFGQQLTRQLAALSRQLMSEGGGSPKMIQQPVVALQLTSPTEHFPVPYPAISELFKAYNISPTALRSNVLRWQTIRSNDYDNITTLRRSSEFVPKRLIRFFLGRFMALQVPFLTRRQFLAKYFPNDTQSEKTAFNTMCRMAMVANALITMFETVLVLRIWGLIDVSYPDILCSSILWFIGVAAQCSRESIAQSIEYMALSEMRYFRLQVAQFLSFDPQRQFYFDVKRSEIRCEWHERVSVIQVFFSILEKDDTVLLWLEHFTRVPAHVQEYYDNQKQLRRLKGESVGRNDDSRRSSASTFLAPPLSPFRTKENIAHVAYRHAQRYNFGLNRNTILPYIYTFARAFLPTMISFYSGENNLFNANIGLLTRLSYLATIVFSVCTGLFLTHIVIRDALTKISTLQKILNNFIRSIDLQDDGEKVDKAIGIYITSEADVEAMEALYYCFHDFYRFDATFQKSVQQILPVCGVMAVAVLISSSFQNQNIFQQWIVCLLFDATTSTVVFIWALTAIAHMNDQLSTGVVTALEKQSNRIRSLAYSAMTQTSTATLGLDWSPTTLERAAMSLDRFISIVRRREAMYMFGFVSIDPSTVGRIGTVIGIGLFTTMLRFLVGVL
jgi:hypothetical protein